MKHGAFYVPTFILKIISNAFWNTLRGAFRIEIQTEPSTPFLLLLFLFPVQL